MKKIILLLAAYSFVNASQKITSASIASWKCQPMPEGIFKNLKIIYDEKAKDQPRIINKTSREEYAIYQKALHEKIKIIDSAK